ncbi:MAG: hypothetical protein ABSG40_21900 [Terriglobales bacterium]|jgi:hypothetical protein
MPSDYLHGVVSVTAENQGDLRGTERLRRKYQDQSKPSMNTGHLSLSEGLVALPGISVMLVTYSINTGKMQACQAVGRNWPKAKSQ